MSFYEAVFCDIDGTLLTSDHRITERTKAKIQALHRSGIPFILVSARMPAAIYPIQEELGIQAPVISYGGALILDKNRKTIHSIGLPVSQAQEIQNRVPPENDDYRFCIYSGNTWISSDHTHPIIRREEEITKVSSISGTMEALLSKDEKIHKLMCFAPSSFLDSISADLKQTFPQCTIYKSFHNLLEIMDGRVSKSNAVHILCRYLDVSPQSAVAFGDNYNDIDMLQAVGLGVAMGNAPEEVKAKASEITADNDHEGLLLALNRLFPTQPIVQ